MANEATLVVETQLPFSFTCANATGIEKGAICKMTDPRTAALSTTAADVVAGICASEKIASDGTTSVSIYRSGWFKVTLSGTCTAGDILITDGSANLVKRKGSVALSGGKVLGIALETGTNGETILMELNCQAVNID